METTNTPNEGKRNEPTKSELEILQVLWQQGPSTVRLVNDELNKIREVNYSSTLKLMQIMLDKKLLTRDIVDRIHIYRPSEAPEVTRGQVIRGLRDLAFDGSTSKLVLSALGDGKTTLEDLEKIKKLIEELEEAKKG
jgi:BlaI family transcriptional regulator, penicillinase repressor